ncbi:histidine phosphatase family protein [Leptospira semungkisensis]|uniref:Histidine phosphatase family protein n=1 Tax=Leptospira semungkisensis TaxID=2484985 RepID=A0A4R9G772_9LEPT|nr:histidine phosphatase family protein [Leptospira semungkisensis]TGK07085.1 histidine phosphatase family protein [Leptospira semungkisensis]
MKQIHLIRHSKSDWENLSLKDKDRPLSKRGRKNARFLAKYMDKVSFSTDLALVSPSKRTKETLHILEESNSISKETHVVDEIYEADYSDLLRLIRGVDPKKESVLCIGHNPGFEDLANFLLLKDPESSLFEKFPTSSFISLVSDAESWEDIGIQKCRLVRFWIP